MVSPSAASARGRSPVFAATNVPRPLPWSTSLKLPAGVRISTLSLRSIRTDPSTSGTTRLGATSPSTPPSGGSRLGSGPGCRPLPAQRQLDKEGRSDAGLAFGPNSAAVAADDRRGDVQAESKPAVGRGLLAG